MIWKVLSPTMLVRATGPPNNGSQDCSGPASGVLPSALRAFLVIWFDSSAAVLILGKKICTKNFFIV